MPDQFAARGRSVLDRHRADFPEGTVVFLIGMRINRLRSVRAWLQVFLAMPRMLRELFQHPELGMLDARSTWSGRNTTVIQYWESMDKLMAYAAARDHAHLPAWKAFNRMARQSHGAVGSGTRHTRSARNGRTSSTHRCHRSGWARRPGASGTVRCHRSRSRAASPRSGMSTPPDPRQIAREGFRKLRVKRVLTIWQTPRRVNVQFRTSPD